MKTRSFRTLLTTALIAVIAVSILTGCSAAPTTSSTPSSQETTIRIGLLPISEATPVYLAESEGYFKAANVKVEIINFTSAVERDMAMQTGQLDAIINDPVSALLLSKEMDDVRIVKITIKAMPQQPMISILANPKSNIKSASDLKNTEIAISKNSVIEYVTDRLLAKQGFKPEEIKKTEVSKIPVRLEMLMNNQINAASMPDPFAFLAKQQGAKLVLDDGENGLGFSCITFRQAFLEKNGAGVKGFLSAHAKAVDMINANPEQYRALLVDKAKLPEAVATTFPMPTFPTPMVPTKAEMEDVENWMKTNGLLTRDVSYDKVVDGSYIK